MSRIEELLFEEAEREALERDLDSFSTEELERLEEATRAGVAFVPGESLMSFHYKGASIEKVGGPAEEAAERAANLARALLAKKTARELKALEEENAYFKTLSQLARGRRGSYKLAG